MKPVSPWPAWALAMLWLLVSSQTLQVVIPAGLAAGEYALTLVNGDGVEAAAPRTLGSHAPEAGCFFDRFGSGGNQWLFSGDWDIVTIIPSSSQALTDSPTGPYRNAGDYGNGLLSYTTMATSTGFSLAGCGAEPVLEFRQAYALDNLGQQQDVGRVELSTDGGISWSTLVSVTGGGPFEAAAQQVVSPEWAGVELQPVQLDLTPYAGAQNVRLRFSLEVDQEIADKGWLIDDLLVRPAEIKPETSSHNLFLPLILK